MASYVWTSNTNGDWTTAANWASNTVPNDPAADVTINAPATLGPYTVTIAAGETETVHSLTLNADGANLIGVNSPVYDAAELELDGTLIFAPNVGDAAGLLDGSLQTFVHVGFGSNAEIINAGTTNGFIQVSGNLLITGTNGFYCTNDIQALSGTVTVDTSSIAEMTGTTLFDGIYEAQGNNAAIYLGGTLQHNIVNIATIEGPQGNPGGWTALTLNGNGASIQEWNGSAYVSIETSISEIRSGGTLDILSDMNYTTTNTLTIDSVGVSNATGMLHLHAGTVTTAGIAINGGIVQGFGTLVGNVANNGTVIALGGTLNLTGSLTGTGSVAFDTDEYGGAAGKITPAGATLIVNSVSAGQTITMNGDDILQINALGSFAGEINAKVGDQIVLQGVTATSAVLTNGVLAISNGSTVVGSLALSGSYTGDSFTVNGSTITVASAPVLTVPTISGAVAGQAVNSTGTLAPFAGVHIADANIGQTETVTVTLSAAANGAFTNLGGGTYDTTAGTYKYTGTAAAASVALEGLVFKPTANQAAPGQSVTTVFTINDVDTASQTASNTVTSVIATTAIITPTITGTILNQAVTDQTTIKPFANVVIGDQNAGQSETVVVTMSAPADGVLSNLAGGSYNATTGVYTTTGSLSAVNSALNGLVFTPTGQQVAPGKTVTTGFTINDTDTAGAKTATASTSVVATAASRNFIVTDTTANTTMTSAGAVYTGPVAGLQYEMIDITTENLNITSTVPNTFLRSGSGMDGLNVSLANGNNVLDGSTGSNFLTGGTGDDTFYMDDRDPTAPIFSTVVNFHSGDNVTVWGVNATDFSKIVLENEGATGFKGVDLLFRAPGQADVSFVLAGWTSADLTNGRLSSSYGTTADLPGVPGSQYLTIHAN